ncbi:MAG: peptidoglycan-binding protein [Eubacteriales bacterium]
MEIVNIMDLAVRTQYLQERMRYLALALHEPDLSVTVTGTYNEESERAVRYFQKTRHLPATGVVDAATWEALVDEYFSERRLREPVLVRPVPNSASFSAGPGERGDHVVTLQMLLNALRYHYDYPPVPLSGVYGAQTSEAVRGFQHANALDATGIADRRTWDRIAEEYNLLLE